MAGARGTSGFIVNGAGYPQQPQTLGGIKHARSLRKGGGFQGRLRPVTNGAGCGADAGSTVHLFLDVGELDLPLLIENSYALYLLQSSNVFDDLVDVVTGIERHGIVRTQLDGVAQSIGFLDHVIGGVFLVVLDVGVGPDGDAPQQDQSDPEDEPEGQTAAYVSYFLQHWQPRIYVSEYLKFARTKTDAVFETASVSSPLPSLLRDDS